MLYIATIVILLNLISLSKIPALSNIEDNQKNIKCSTLLVVMFLKIKSLDKIPVLGDILFEV